MSKIILSLFDHSGNWSKPYKDNGFEVIQIDEKLGTDIMQWDYKAIDKDRVFGILAAPPCTDFSLSGSQYWRKKDSSGQTERSLQLIKKTLEVVDYFKSDLVFWVLENPPGRLEKLIPELSKLKIMSFQPHEFGDAYTKLTNLYGCFCPLLIRDYVEPLRSGDSGHHSIDILNIGRYGKLSFHKRGELRSITPKGFAKAFYEANH